MILVSDVVLRIRKRLGDTDSTKYKWNDEELIDYINSSLSQISAELLVFTDKKEIGLENGKGRYALPFDLVTVISVNINNLPVVIKSFEWLENNKHTLDNDNFYVCMDEDSIYIYPEESIKDGAKLEIGYKYIVQVNDLNDEINLSLLASDAIMFYSLHLAFQINTSEKNEKKSINNLNLFNNQISIIKSKFYSNKHSRKIRSKYRKV